MGTESKSLEQKLRDMYPEIAKHDLSLSLNFDETKNAWVVMLSKGKHELKTHLEKRDAEDCLEGVECVYLGVQIGQFIKNFESS